MPESTEFVIARGHATLSAQTDIAGVWVWDEKTVANWTADIASVHTQQEVVTDANADKEGLAGELEAQLEQLHKDTLKGLNIAKAKYRNDPAKYHLLKNLSAGANSRAGQLEEALEWESMWQEIDAAWTPVTGMTLAGFKTARQACETKLEAHSNSKANWRGEAEKLNGMLEKLNDNCIGWYKAATAVFPEGTAEGDMIRGTVPTTYNPTELPEAATMTLVDAVGTDGMEVSYAAEHATSYDVYLQGPGAGPFVLKAADRVETDYVYTGLAPGEYLAMARGKNSTGVGPEGESASFTIA